MSLTADTVLAALRQVMDPDLGKDIVTLDFVKHLQIDGAAVRFQVELTTPACPEKEALRKQAHDVVAALPGVEEVEIQMTARVPQSASPGPTDGTPLPQVRNIIAVGAGKGGVGKSTIAANLALALAESGASVGLLDGDVYGPSVPKMFGDDARVGLDSDEKHLMPSKAHGIKLMSIGYLVDPQQPMVVRGPIVHSAIRQFLGDVAWGALDYLVVDLPPGTGDVALSLAQFVPLAGAVLVSTPQDVSLLDVQKAVNMFHAMDVPVLGVVENMSFYVCPDCGHRDDIFGHGGAQAWAMEKQLPFLGGVPIHTSVRAGGDGGLPALVDPSTPEEVKAAFRAVAAETARQVSIAALAKPAAPVAVETDGAAGCSAGGCSSCS